eukprot:5320726-Prymnesium_polylepis.1
MQPLEIVGANSGRQGESGELDAQGAPVRRKSGMRKLWQAKSKEVACMAAGTFKVPLSNKAGKAPTGEAAVVALALHTGLQNALLTAEREIAAAGARSSSDSKRLTWWKSRAVEQAAKTYRRASGISMRLTARRFTIDPDKQISTTDGKGAADGVEVKCVDPVLFLRIRQAFGVDEANFYASICLQPGRAETDMTMIGGSEAAGKSCAPPSPVGVRLCAGVFSRRAGCQAPCVVHSRPCATC